MKKDDKKWRLGIILNQGRIRWAFDSPFLGVPQWIQEAISYPWNIAACFVLGHSHLVREAPGKTPVCCECCRPVKKFDEESVVNAYIERPSPKNRPLPQKPV